MPVPLVTWSFAIRKGLIVELNAYTLGVAIAISAGILPVKYHSNKSVS